MGRKKKRENKKQKNPLQLKEAVHSRIGIIGWNSPRFLESHSQFMEALKTNIASCDLAPVFFGISGSLDQLDLTVSNGQKKSSHASLPLFYHLPSRDMAADQIEMIACEERLAGLVMIPWSINSLVGMLMATVRSGLPAVFMPSYSSWNRLYNGSSAAENAENKEASFLGLPYSSCSMLLLLEVFGLAKMGSLEKIIKQEALALSEDLNESAKWCGQRIFEMVKQKVSVRRFFSEASIHNAIAVDMSLGGSSETVLHLAALAQEAGVPLPLATFSQFSKVPQLIGMDRSGNLSLAEFEKCGGLAPLLSALYSFLKPSPTVMGKNIVDIAKASHEMRSSFKVNNPVKKYGGLKILYGSLAKEGALFRVSALKENWLSYSGKVKVFNSQAACIEAVLNKKIKKGEILAVRYAGPRGTPGMPALEGLKAALSTMDLEEYVAILTDGRMPNSGKTPVISHICPEAAVGGAFSILEDGDTIIWNFLEGTLTARLTETEIKVRLSRWKAQTSEPKNSLLHRYLKHVSSTVQGAKLI